MVAIGRNEGERLRACLQSLSGQGFHVVYVDSASSDGSPAVAEKFGATIVELDMTRPFSAARARNEGFTRLMEIAPQVDLVHFIDGDCILVEGWMEQAVRHLQSEPGVAVVCGRRRERFPEASIYNRLCDMEWNSPIGEAKTCGGDALMRKAAFVQVGGFNASIMSGEEPELCSRLRQAGWKIARLDHDMTLHDAAITRFGQYWRRMVRGGYGLGQLAKLREADYPSHRRIVSAILWGGIIPLVFVLSLGGGFFWLPLWGISAAGLLLILALLVRCWYFRRAKGDQSPAAALYALLILPVKMAHLLGLWHFVRGQYRKQNTALIEYKVPVEAAASAKAE